MNRSLTETQVLRKLGITDFRHMTKDKVVSFVSMLPAMDPAVATKALEQFPSFAETGRAVVTCLKEGMAQASDANAANMAAYNARCEEALGVLEAQLEREDLSDEGRRQVIDGILSIIDAMGRKDAENKAFLGGILQWFLGSGCIVILCLGAALGLKLKTPSDRD